MSLEGALQEELRQGHDPRSVLLELAFCDGALVGVAEARLTGRVRAFAERHGLEVHRRAFRNPCLAE